MSEIIASFNRPNRQTPLRAYLFDFGFEEQFGTQSAALEHLLEVSSPHAAWPMFARKRKYSYVLGMLWGDGARMVDFFGFYGMQHWPSNPECDLWVMRNNIYVPEIRGTCASSLIILGEEEKYRRTTESLFVYLDNPLPIEKLNELIAPQKKEET